MAKLTTLSQNIFSERAEKAIKAQPLRKKVFLAELTIVSEDKISYKGSSIKMTKSAFKDLLKCLQIPQTFIKRFSEMMKDKPEARQQFINTIKNLMSNKGSGSTSVSLVLSQESREIIAVHKNERNLISNKSVMDLVTRVVDENGLDVVDFSIGRNGEVAINAVDKNATFDVKGLKDEVFNGGVSFVNNPRNGFIVAPYINRLVCANGMMSRGFSEEYRLNTFNGDSMQKFFSDLGVLAKNGFKPETFVSRVEEAVNLKASLSEMYSVKKAIKYAAKDITKEELESWVPLMYTENAYKRIGIQPELLRSAQLKNASTDTSVWDLINGLTHFATHKNGFEIDDYNRRQLQVTAGQLLTSEHDLANFVRNPFRSYQAKNAF